MLNAELAKGWKTFVSEAVNKLTLYKQDTLYFILHILWKLLCISTSWSKYIAENVPNTQKEDFNQGFECTALKRWVKYTTFEFPVHLDVSAKEVSLHKKQIPPSKLSLT